ncbi:hypothetical protein [Collinsella tanakaei]|nr:hypothetical protein [Collinsella tanakaei]
MNIKLSRLLVGIPLSFRLAPRSRGKSTITATKKGATDSRGDAN